MRNILFVTNSGNPGGMEKHVLDLVVGLGSYGNKIYLWCAPGPLVQVYEEAGAIVTPRKIGFEFDIPYILSLKKFIKDKNIDVIYANEPKAVFNALIGSFLGGAKKRISHTHTPISQWKVSPLKKFPTIVIYSAIVNLLASKEVALSNQVREAKVGEGISRSKLTVIPNGVDYDRYQIPDSERSLYKSEIRKKYNIPDDAFVIGNISRLTVEKGYDVLIKAVSLLSRTKSSNKLFLLIAGGGERESYYKEMLKSSGLSKMSVVTGQYQEPDKKKFQSALDLLVFPSFAEGFGYVLVEAMAFGIPVLSSDIEVLKEVGGDTISYFPSGDPLALSLAIKEMMENWSESLSHVPEARDRVKNVYGIKQFWANYESLISG